MTDIDPYCYPGTSVLKNLGGHKTAQKLKAFETLVVTLRAKDLFDNPIQGEFSISRLKETHRRLFEGVYAWAGQFREQTGWIGKDRGLGYGGVRYCDSRFIDNELNKVFQSLAETRHLKGLPLEQFPERAAYFYGELDAIHPFREGNSRTLRKFMFDMGVSAGYEMHWEKTNRDENTRNRLYRARDIAVLRADHSELTKIFTEVTTPVKDTSKKNEQDWELGF